MSSNASRSKPAARVQISVIRELIKKRYVTTMIDLATPQHGALMDIQRSRSSEVSQSNKTGRCNGKSTKSTRQDSSSGTGKPSPSASSTCAKTVRKISKGKSGRKDIQGSRPPLNQARTPCKANLSSAQPNEHFHGPERKPPKFKCRS